MSEVWTPRKGEKVKMTTTKSLIGGGRRVMSIRLVEVKAVTKAGYVTVSCGLRDKFGRSGDRVFSERRLKTDVFLDFHTSIEPATAEEIDTLPTDIAGARDFARARQQEIAA